MAKIQYEFADESQSRLKRYLLNSHTPSKSTISKTAQSEATDTVREEESSHSPAPVVETHFETTIQDDIPHSSPLNEEIIVEANDESNSCSEVIQKADMLEDKSEYCCSKCSSESIQVIYGKYGYYFKCDSCGGNTNIPKTCVSKECKPKVRKEKLNFYMECPTCESSTLFFTNSEG